MRECDREKKVKWMPGTILYSEQSSTNFILIMTCTQRFPQRLVHYRFKSGFTNVSFHNFNNQKSMSKVDVTSFQGYDVLVLKISMNTCIFRYLFQSPYISEYSRVVSLFSGAILPWNPVNKVLTGVLSQDHQLWFLISQRKK